MSVFGSVSSILHQCVFCLLELSVFPMRNGYFPFFFRYHHFMVDEFIHVVGWKNTQKIDVFISYFFESFFNLEVTIPSVTFYTPPKSLFMSSFAFFLCFFHYVICNVRIECISHIFF